MTESEKPISKQTQVAELRAQFSELVSNSSSIEEARELLMQSGLVAKVVYKQQKSGNRYLQVKTTLGTRNINLRGTGFEQLESFYYSADELALQLEKKNSKKTTRGEAEERHQSIYERHQMWCIAQEKKRPKATPIKYEETQKKYEKKFTERLKEARIYYVLYHDNIEEHLIKGYQIWEKNNTRYLFNNDLGVKLYDQPNKITLQIPDDPIKRCNAVALMLAMAQSKGWNINTLKMTGSEAFKSEVKQQIAMINHEKNRLILAEQQDQQVEKPSIAPKPQSLSPIKPKLNAIDQAIKDNKQTNARKLSKEQIVSIKTDLDAQTVIDYAVQKLGLIAKHFSITKDNKIGDDRLKSKPRNVIDFLTKTCNLKFTDVMPLVEQMLEVQTEKQEQKLGFQ